MDSNPEYEELCVLTNVKLPPAPSDPPTLSDISVANLLIRDLMKAYGEPINEKFDIEDVGRAVLYEHRLVASYIAANDHDQGVPAWFEAALQHAFAPLQTQLDDLCGKVDDLQLEGSKTVPLLILQMMNRSAGNGDDAALEIVPFRDGSYPTLPFHSLPALTSPTIIRNLSLAELEQYYRGYYAGVLPQAGELISLIFSAIGRKEE
ncbi:hypothetical protein AGABI1DRAFT_94471 [Agaricus bisporus var. burnettii JB137-S8]|uniref:Mug135-like C-terminal domain-containing protein n=1 Tax=Agaricus bisporus var. burnettii (strain JB137-S8 / ATCC MYA-4627 / FGSC 10392) TaxID=597362 RepID=K5WZG6_AGABU|nr:uncharacterized protein AGABI1DRAFT_94471 [Agaricus bisporus var. burnettii JB137-S8]EKM76012.1 hypothetical protein AGABI1DRAFT_94471 [Agaricus bisporus var. burnettii JB137-S8]